MMASRCNPQYFLNQWLSLRLLALVLAMTSHISVTESVTAPIQIRGEVGGNVTIHCPFVKDRKIKFFYFQKGSTFVNGYYASKNLSTQAGIQIWENTRVDRDKTTVHMYNLNVSHIGSYQCHIQYSDTVSLVETLIQLNITANYSKPEVTVRCTDENEVIKSQVESSPHFCMVRCASHAGYPETNMTWNMDKSPAWLVVNSSKIHDPRTMMVNSSSTAYFNCSNGELTFLSCSVGDVTSDMFSVCTPNPPKTYFGHYVIAAICSVVFFSIMGILLCFWKYKKGKRGARVSQDVILNGCEAEVIALNEKNGGEEAS